MPIGTRDILLIIRANDQASRVVRSIGSSFDSWGKAQGRVTQQQKELSRAMVQTGSAMMTVGAGITAVGIGILAALGNAVNASIQYNREVALTATQIDEATRGTRTYAQVLKEVGDIGRRVAMDIPVPFEEIQAALYDIFSSMEVSMEGAESLLRGFAMAAVAGQVDIQTAARATIAVWNSYGRSAGSLGDILDWQFQMVRKGVGTYKEFATVIGRALPAFRAAGQPIEQLGASMVFLTRSGLNTAMAATSAARAMELLANEQSVRRLESMGFTMRDSVTGNLLPMSEILGQISEKWGKLDNVARKQMFVAAFNQGRIQARRFFDLVIPNFAQFQKYLDDFSSDRVSGSMKRAFEEMADTPAMKMELLTNRMKVLRTTMGDALIPVVVVLADKIGKLVGWFNDLDPAVKAAISQGILLFGALTVLLGIVTLAAGAMTTLAGAILGLGLASSAATAAFWAGGLIATLMLLPALAVAIIYHWETIVKVFNAVKDAAANMFDLSTWQGMVAASIALTVAVVALRKAIIQLMATALGKAFGGWIMSSIRFTGSIHGATAATTLFARAQALAGKGVAGLAGGLKFLASPAGIITAAIIALTVVLAAAYFEWKKGEEAARNVGDQWDRLAARDPGKAISRLEEEISNLNTSLENMRARQKEIQDQLRQGGITGDQANELRALKEAIDFAEDRMEGYQTQLGKTREEALKAKDAFLDTLPPELRADAEAASEGMADLGEDFKKTAEEARRLHEGVKSAFNNAGDVMSEFKDKAVVSLQEVNNALHEQIRANQDFYNNLRTLQESGAITAQQTAALAAEGPKAMGGMVRALVEDVKNGSGEMTTAWSTSMMMLDAMSQGAANDLVNMQEMHNQTLAVIQTTTGQMVMLYQQADGAIAATVQTTQGWVNIPFDPLKMNLADVTAALGGNKAEAANVYAQMLTLNQTNFSQAAGQIQGMGRELGLTRDQAVDLKKWLQQMRTDAFKAMSGDVVKFRDDMGLTKKEAEKFAEELKGIKGTNFNPVKIDTDALARKLGIAREKTQAFKDWLIQAGQGGKFNPTQGQLDQLQRVLGNTDPARQLTEALKKAGSQRADDSISAMRGIDRSADGAARSVQNIQRRIDNLRGKVVTITIKERTVKERHQGGAVGQIRRYHRGGDVLGHALRNDEVLGILQRGEWVLDRRTTSRLGPQFLRRLQTLHEGGPAGFAMSQGTTPAPSPSQPISGGSEQSIREELRAMREAMLELASRPVVSQAYLDGDLVFENVKRNERFDTRRKS